MNRLEVHVEGTTKMQYPTRLRGADLTLAERAVLLNLWTYSDADMTNAWPSRTRIAEDCQMSREGVRKALRALESKGYVVAVARGGWTDEGNRATNYSLTLPGMGATQLPPGGNTDGGQGATESPLPDPSPDPLPDPPSAPSLRSEQSSLRSPSLSERRRDRGDTRKHLLSLVRAIATAQTDEDHEAASEAFLEAFTDAGHEDIGYWDYGRHARLDSLVRKYGTDYGSATWLGTFTNSSEAA